MAGGGGILASPSPNSLHIFRTLTSQAGLPGAVRRHRTVSRSWWLKREGGKQRIIPVRNQHMVTKLWRTQEMIYLPWQENLSRPPRCIPLHVWTLGRLLGHMHIGAHEYERDNKWNWINFKINEIPKALHWALLHCWYNAAALFPTELLWGEVLYSILVSFIVRLAIVVYACISLVLVFLGGLGEKAGRLANSQMCELGRQTLCLIT